MQLLRTTAVKRINSECAGCGLVFNGLDLAFPGDNDSERALAGKEESSSTGKSAAGQVSAGTLEDWATPNHGANGGILNFPVTEVDAAFVADLELSIIRLLWS